MHLDREMNEKTPFKRVFRGSIVATLTVVSLMAFLGVYVWLEESLTGTPIKMVLRPAELKDSLKEARQHLEAMRFKESESLFREALVSDPSNAAVHNMLGLSLKKQGRTKEAIAFYETAVTLRPGFFEARNNLAVALEAVGRGREAEGVYLRALRDAPADPTLHLNYALLLESKTRAEEAIGHYYTFISLSEDEGLKELVRARISGLR